MSKHMQQHIEHTDPSNEQPHTKRRVSMYQLWNDGIAVLRARWHFRNATSIGPRTRMWGNAVVQNKGAMIIGNRVRFVSTIVPIELHTGARGRLEIGDSTFINYGCSIAATQSVQIGPRCHIGTYVIMMDNDFHEIEPERRTEMPPSAPITLEENVWLGARVIVLRGVRIGAGSVIGAGSIVTKDIPPRSLAVGLPARVIRQI
jgi:acetyltransferase-like isoleucine patch superfamily enzyme